MLDLNLVKSLMKRDLYQSIGERVTPNIFGEGPREVFELVRDAHEQYDTDLSVEDIMALWRMKNPVATAAVRGDFRDLLDDVQEAKDLAPEIASSAIQSLWRRKIGQDIAQIGLEISEDQYSGAMAQLRSLLEKVEGDFDPDDFGEDTTQDLDELLELIGNDHRFRFNIPTLSNKVYGIGPEEFMVLFATPETGKTAFIVSLCCGPDGFVDQGKKVAILGNEESTKRTVVRAYQAVTGMDGDEIALEPEIAKTIYRNKTEGKLIFRDIQNWDMEKLRAYLKKKKPDVVVIDQLDKVDVGGSYEKGHEKLRQIYLMAREVAKECHCALIGVSQASNDAAGKTRLHYNMMEGSKIGKAAEADLIIGIGKESRDESDDPCLDRYLTVSKNKLSGWHGTVMCQIVPQLSRYVA